MCGICLIVLKGTFKTTQEAGDHVGKSRLFHRGPDIQREESIHLSSKLLAHFTGCTLHFRGTVTSQPLQDQHQNLLLWNGEIFGGLEVPSTVNDGAQLLSLLAGCKTDAELLQQMVLIKGPWSFVFWQAKSSKLWFGRDYFGRRSLLCHFSEDQRTFGLSSVALKSMGNWKELPACGLFCASFNLENKSEEIVENITVYPWVKEAMDCGGLRVLPHGTASKPVEDLHLWDGLPVIQGDWYLVPWLAPFNREIPGESDTHCSNMSGISKGSDFNLKDVNLMDFASEGQESLVHKLIEFLGEAVRIRVQSQSCLCDLCIKSFLRNRQTPEEELPEHSCTHDATGRASLENTPHQTSTVECSTCDTPGTQTKDSQLPATSDCDISSEHKGKCTAGSNHGNTCIKSIATDNQQMISGSNVECSSVCSHSSQSSLHPIPGIDSYDTSRDETQTRSGNLSTHHKEGLTCEHARVADHKEGLTCGHARVADHKEGLTCGHARVADHKEGLSCRHARVAVLFSGGIDSLVITALADRYIDEDEPIDLLNVAFEQKPAVSGKPSRHQKQTASPSPSNPYDVPDRITGREGAKLLNPRRIWNFVEIDVTAAELQECRSSDVAELVYPLQTVLDDSIGCAVWFAARGKGSLVGQDGSRQPYNSTARVVLVGMGADEQLAGYSRHRVKFNTGGWQSLVEEVEMEINRISTRNLGRDDRIITDHGKEARFPFLDENVVSFLNTVPIWSKADLTLPRGVGEKLLLRQAATFLGLGPAATLPKRAIQFGSRIAKLENRKEKASDVCHRLEDG